MKKPVKLKKTTPPEENLFYGIRAEMRSFPEDLRKVSIVARRLMTFVVQYKDLRWSSTAKRKAPPLKKWALRDAAVSAVSRFLLSKSTDNAMSYIAALVALKACGDPR
jgi:hypothetical protein